MKEFIVRIYTRNSEIYHYSIHGLNYTSAKQEALTRYLKDSSGESIFMIIGANTDIIAEDYLT